MPIVCILLIKIYHIYFVELLDFFRDRKIKLRNLDIQQLKKKSTR